MYQTDFSKSLSDWKFPIAVVSFASVNPALDCYCYAITFLSFFDVRFLRILFDVGGDMATSSAAYDPLFYSIHAFIDYLFDQWQEKHRDVQVGLLHN